MVRVAETLVILWLVAIILVVISVSVVVITNNNQEVSMASEQYFTTRAYDLGKKPIEASGKYRIRLYSGGHVIKDWETEKHPYISDSGFVYIDGVRVSGTVIVEEVKP